MCMLLRRYAKMTDLFHVHRCRKTKVTFLRTYAKNILCFDFLRIYAKKSSHITTDAQWVNSVLPRRRSLCLLQGSGVYVERTTGRTSEGRHRTGAAGALSFAAGASTGGLAGTDVVRADDCSHTDDLATVDVASTRVRVRGGVL